TVGVLELHRPQVRELALLNGVLREPCVAAQPAAALRVEAARRPLVTTAALCVQKDDGRRNQHSGADESLKASCELLFEPSLEPSLKPSLEPSLEPLSAHGYFTAVG